MASNQPPIATDGSPTLLSKDLRCHPNKKRSLKLVIYHYTEEKLITAILYEYRYGTPPGRVSMFDRLSKTPKQPSAHHKRRTSNEECQEVIVNMTGRGHARSAAPRYDTGGKPRQDRVYCHTRNHDTRLPPPDYERVNAEAFKAHNTIAMLSASSSDKGPTSVNMTGTSEELAYLEPTLTYRPNNKKNLLNKSELSIVFMP